MFLFHLESAAAVLQELLHTLNGSTAIAKQYGESVDFTLQDDEVIPFEQCAACAGSSVINGNRSFRNNRCFAYI